MSTGKDAQMTLKIAGDATGAIASVRQLEKATRDAEKAAERASAENAANLNKLASSSQKAATAVTGTVDALTDLQRRGAAAFGDLVQQGGVFASLLGPGGAIVGATAIATAAIVAIFLRSRQELRQLREAFDSEVRSLERSNDVGGLSARQRALFSGDRLFGDPNSVEEKDNARLRRLNDAIRGGGLQQVGKELAPVLAILREFPPAVEAGGLAIEAFNERRERAERKKRELLETERLLREEYTKVSGALGRVLPGLVEQEAVGARLKQQEEDRRKGLQDEATLTGKLLELQKRSGELAETLRRDSAEKKTANDVLQLVDAYERLGVPVRALQSEIAALSADLADGSGGADAAARLSQIDREYGNILETVSTLTVLQERFAGKEAIAAGAKFLKAIEDENEQLREQNALRIKQAETRDDARDAQERELAQREAEIQALTRGAAAYEDYLRQQAQEAAARELIEQRRREGKQATAQELIDARTNAALLFDAVKLADQLRNSLTNSGAGKLAGELAAVAESATQVAQSLGDAGRNLAVVAGIAGPLLSGLSGLQGALQRRDSSGNVISGQSASVLDALRGRNGKDSQAQAIAGSLSIIGAVGTVADALDLFGTRARQKAAEMKEAARVFAASLEDFAASANPQTGASEAIRQAQRQAAELARQAAAAGGGSVSFDAAGITSAELRKRAEDLRGMAAATERTNSVGRELAAQLRTIAAGFEDVASTLAEVEAEARAQVRRNIEDLAVRRLQAAGLTEQAEAERERLERTRAVAAAERDVTAEGREYLAALKAIQLAEQAAAAAAQRRAAILEELDNANTFVGGSDSDRVRRDLDAFVRAFPEEFAGLFDGIDVATQAGLEKARETVRALYARLAEDGITDAERPIVDFLKRIIGDIGTALAALPEALDPVAAALAAFAAQVDVFGLSAAEQLSALVEIFRSSDLADVQTLLKGAELDSPQGLAALQVKLQNAIRDILADGVITTAEQPVLEALRQLLGNVSGALDDLAASLAAGAAKLEAERQQRVADASRRLETTLSLSGATGEEALQARLQSLGGLSPALQALLPVFDTASTDGIERTKGLLFDLFRAIDEGRVPAAALGDLTRDQVIDAIVGLNGELNGLASALLEAAEATAAAAEAERQATQDLEIRALAAGGSDTRLAAFDLAASRERQRATEEGRSEGYLAFLAEVQGRERTKLLQAIAVEASEALVRVAGVGSGGTATPAALAGSRSTVRSDIGSLSEVTAQSLAGLIREVAVNTGERGALVAAILSSRAGVPSLAGVSFPTYGAATPAGSISVGPIYITVATNAADPSASPQETGILLSEALKREIRRWLGRELAAEFSFLGSARI